jgi:hypothetical protein
MAESTTRQGDLKVTLSKNGERVTRSVRVLVAEAFVAKPPTVEGFHKSSIPDTVIVLDNDKDNLIASNLAWRPAWFAWKYARQFQPSYRPEFYSKRVMNLSTRRTYSSILEAGVTEGLLFDDIFRSAVTGCHIYPTQTNYVFV